MILLGRDTSGYANAVGLTDGEKILADARYEARTDSLEKIVANIDAVIKKAGLTLGGVGGIGVGLGPGSWTGIRVGVTVGKILAYAGGKPVCGVSTLEALAYEARREASLICPVIGMGAGDAVYAAFYKAGNGRIKQLGEYYVGGVPGLAAMIEEPALIVGSGAAKYAGEIRNTPGFAQNITALETAPGGASVAALAALRLAVGESDDALALTPLYLKESTARAFTNRYAGKTGAKE